MQSDCAALATGYEKASELCQSQGLIKTQRRTGIIDKSVFPIASQIRILTMIPEKVDIFM